ncbi:hypothetical protein GCM10020000_79330 [Streptomyces olivoverticillatus]
MSSTATSAATTSASAAPAPQRGTCVEGFWALRLDHDGGLMPCLLRSDLRMDLKALLDDPDRLAAAVAGHIAAFTEGTL